jgi:hypothetical protein
MSANAALLAATPREVDLGTCDFRELFNPPPLAGSRLLGQDDQDETEARRTRTNSPTAT